MEWERQMLPPPPGTFSSRQELIHQVGEFSMAQGYVVTIKHSKKDRVVILGCDRGGVRRNQDKLSGDPNPRKRKTVSRLTNCPFEAVGKNVDGSWILTVKNGSHNHEPLKDISDHPSARRFSEKEVLLIKEMTQAGLKPRQILNRLRQINPELLSTPKHVYNVNAKLRQGDVAVGSFKSFRPEKPALRDSEASSERSWRQHYPPMTNISDAYFCQRFPNLIGGAFVDSQSSTSIDVINPATQLVVAQVPFTTNEEFKAAVYAAKMAFPQWRSTSVATRQRIMFRFRELILRDIDKLTTCITAEHGKPMKDAHDEILHGLEAVENTCALATLQVGEFTSNVSTGFDSFNTREPIGICAGICSYEFPALIPLWTFPVALTCGNTFVLKPSERDPGAAVILAELALEAGVPGGVLNIVHGTTDTAMNALCDHEDIKAISFVGPSVIGACIYDRAYATRKRVQCNDGAKNYTVVMPDADEWATLTALSGAAFGTAGQKCATICVAVFVGDMDVWEAKLVGCAEAIKLNSGIEPDTELGPLISKQAKERLCKFIQSSVESGARLVLDGRDVTVPGFEHGNFVGPTILSDVTANMDCCKEGSSGPLLLCMKAGNIEAAINIVNSSRWCSGATIFTTSSVSARKFQTEVEVGEVGVNVVLSDPLAPTSSVTSRPFFAGEMSPDGKAGIQFYTKMRRVTRGWWHETAGEDARPLTACAVDPDVDANLLSMSCSALICHGHLPCLPEE